ncbi:hypothetical protein U2E19_18350, partial [Acinetobacter baumannii]
MADKIITRQELVDAQYDAETLGECINGPSNTKVTSRLGRTYWTLATIDYLVSLGLIKIDDLQSAIDIAAAAGAGANGWTDQLIVTSDGKTQKQWNDFNKNQFLLVESYLSGSTEYIDDALDEIKSELAAKGSMSGGTLMLPRGTWRISRSHDLSV